MDINLHTVINILIKNKAEIMIHGHTHQLEIHKIYNSKNNIFYKIALGNWNNYGSMIEIDDKNSNIIITKFPLKNI